MSAPGFVTSQLLSTIGCRKFIALGGNAKRRFSSLWLGGFARSFGHSNGGNRGAVGPAEIRLRSVICHGVQIRTAQTISLTSRPVQMRQHSRRLTQADPVRGPALRDIADPAYFARQRLDSASIRP